MAWENFVIDVHSTPVLPTTERIAKLPIIKVMLSIQKPCTSPKLEKKEVNVGVLGNTTFPIFIRLQSDFSFHHFELDMAS